MQNEYLTSIFFIGNVCLINKEKFIPHNLGELGEQQFLKSIVPDIIWKTQTTVFFRHNNKSEQWNLYLN